MSTVLKADQALSGRIAPSAFHMRDLLAEAHAITDLAHQQSEQIIHRAKQAAVTMWQEAQKKGHDKGFAEGRARGQEEGHQQALKEARERYDRELRSMSDSLMQVLEQVSQQRVQRLREAERDLLQFAIAIAKQVTKGVGRLEPQVAQANITHALSMVMDKSDLVVRINPKDASALQTFMQSNMEKSAPPHVQFIEDEAVEPGGAFLQSAESEIDATLDQQLSQISQALIGQSS